MYEKTTILTETVDKLYAQRHTAGSRDKTDSNIVILMVATHPTVYDRAMAKYNGIRSATNRRSLQWSVHRH